MPSEDRDRQMAVWIAEKVMGWRRAGTYLLYVGDYGMLSNGVVRHVTQTDPYHIEQFDPLTSVSDAIDALDAWEAADGTFLRAATISFQASYKHGARTRCVYLRDGMREVGFGNNTTLPRAICEALCKATGFEG